jgi:hypothetical protein
MSDYTEFEKNSVLNNIMIVDRLFKANGAIHKICSDMQKNDETNREEFFNGFTFSRDPDIYSFYLYAKDFLLKVEYNTIFCFYGDLGVQFKPSSSLKIEQFKQLLLTVINMNSEQQFDNIEQFVDIFNMVHI